MGWYQRRVHGSANLSPHHEVSCNRNSGFNLFRFVSTVLRTSPHSEADFRVFITKLSPSSKRSLQTSAEQRRHSSPSPGSNVELFLTLSVPMSRSANAKSPRDPSSKPSLARSVTPSSEASASLLKIPALSVALSRMKNATMFQSLSVSMFQELSLTRYMKRNAMLSMTMFAPPGLRTSASLQWRRNALQELRPSVK